MKKSRAALRTVDILDLISSQSKGLTLSEIAAKLEIPVTSVKDIMNALLDSGMVEIIDERSKVYGIGVKAYYIGNTYIKNTSLIDKAKDIIEELGERMEKTVFLGKEVNKKITYIFKYEPKNVPVKTCDIGDRTNLHCTSLGKNILAYNPQLLADLKDQVLIKKTEYTITNYDDLVKEVQKVRVQGYALDDREQSNHLLCIGAPIFNGKNELIASVSISGLYADDIDVLGEVEIVKESALRISKKMGYTGN
jgi:DNA-binding IclR family transcriptional regulator